MCFIKIRESEIYIQIQKHRLNQSNTLKKRT